MQELLFVFMLFVLALPKALSLHLIAIAVIVPMLFVVAIVAILTVERLYARVRRAHREGAGAETPPAGDR